MEHNIVSVSGGKDSTALLLLAIERPPVKLYLMSCDALNDSHKSGLLREAA